MTENPYLTELQTTAKHLTQRGKGILAADESTGTIGKRLAILSLENTPETRRALREMLVCAPGNDEAYSGMILFQETLYQTDSSGKPFVSILKEKNILPGIKVDTGLKPVPESPGETTTDGLEDLSNRCASYYAQGARFAKWRAALRIDVNRGLPSDSVVHENARELATYAATAQSEGLLPIVEPEILIDGTHGQEVSAAVAERVISAVYDALREQNVPVELTLLKPMMIMPGVSSEERKNVTPDIVAVETLRVMKKVVPEQVPGIMFLSGGMSEEEATKNLNALNILAEKEKAPWSLSFSFGRALQHSAMKIWNGDKNNLEEAMQMASEVARANGRAQLGKFEGKHPSSGSESLYEGFRGWRGGAPKAV
ncbi:Fructose-bisphosphate aldolase 6, cytosolic [Gracilariopsis chorda]|uniref:fructose-bisphosphate aldolase n=1 Tax=Gracilariopsis chorda TaxID=448386 RepID=A0A2V3IJD6_9FLOR|nr:Fructose-bisphosphate aldolase 6, cytosolic [Gracilariopsis chorda]|eukprot:PXF42169.1 Fructose-bisphosphate aldolase 6, cytosolic [Gracilariopsis chorda]